MTRHTLINRRGIIALVGILGLAACSGDKQMAEPAEPETPAAPISFSAAMPEQEKVTRAETGLEEKDIKTFRVWAYKNSTMPDDDSYDGLQTVMPGFKVSWTENTAGSTTSNTHDWEYVGQEANQTIKYWDFDAKAYRFFGVAPSDATIEETEVTNTITVTADATSDAKIEATPYVTRLWFSNNNYPTYPEFGKQVALKFVKPLVRVRFMFTFAPDLDFGTEALSDYKFKPKDGTTIANKGTVTVTYPLTGTATEETVTTSPTGDGIPALYKFYETESDWFYVLPAPSQDDYELTVNLFTQPKTATVPASYMSWKAGYEYTYIFKITGTDRVTFDNVQAAINDWTPSGEEDHPIYNW